MINNQITYFVNKYENFTKKQFINQIYNINSDGIYNYKDFMMLIKDTNCVPFWNEQICKLSKKIFMPIKNNLKSIKNIKTFNYKNWFNTEHYINCNDIDNNKIEINKQRNYSN